MKYIFNSEKFRNKRKAQYKSQSAFIEALDEKGCKIGRNSISDLENGKIPDDLSLNKIVAFCEVLDCDLEHLLDISDYSTKEIEAVCTYTGLSEQSAKYFHAHKNSHSKKDNISEFISDLIDNYPDFENLILNLQKLLISNYKCNVFSEISDSGKTVIMQNLFDRAIMDSKAALIDCQGNITNIRDSCNNDEYLHEIAAYWEGGLTSTLIKQADKNK